MGKKKKSNPHELMSELNLAREILQLDIDGDLTTSPMMMAQELVEMIDNQDNEDDLNISTVVENGAKQEPAGKDTGSSTDSDSDDSHTQ